VGSGEVWQARSRSIKLGQSQSQNQSQTKGEPKGGSERVIKKMGTGMAGMPVPDGGRHKIGLEPWAEVGTDAEMVVQQ
jgi:hypothetical protein